VKDGTDKMTTQGKIGMGQCCNIHKLF